MNHEAKWAELYEKQVSLNLISAAVYLYWGSALRRVFPQTALRAPKLCLKSALRTPSKFFIGAPRSDPVFR